MTGDTTRAFGLSPNSQGWHRQGLASRTSSPSLGGVQTLRSFLGHRCHHCHQRRLRARCGPLLVRLLSCKLWRPSYKDHRSRLRKLRVNQPVLVFPPCSLNVRPCPDFLLLSTLVLTPFPQLSTWCLHSAFQWPGPPKACPLASMPSFYWSTHTSLCLSLIQSWGQPDKVILPM